MSLEKIKIDLNLKDLNQFYGTVNYYNLNLFKINYKLTDGANYVAENGYTWFITDALINIKMKAHLKNLEFYSIKLILLKNNKAKVIITDGNDIINTQYYDFTDAKKDITLFYTNNVIMLNSEY